MRWSAFAGFVMVLVGLPLACGSSNTPPPPTTFSGSYAMTANHCNGGPGLPGTAPGIEQGRSTKFEWTDAGQALTVSVSDATCTDSIGYHVTYPSDSSFTVTAFGVTTCSPNSASACASLLAAVGALGGACGVALSGMDTWSFTAIPTAAGGTVTITTVAGDAATACSDSGLSNPLQYTLTKL